MATVLMRTPELGRAEKLSIGNRLQTEKALGSGEDEGQQKGSAEGRSRARKGKSGVKKQPQRGLGVAQLEKLRLQEQSKQEAACLASLQGLPAFGFTDQNQNGGMCYRQLKGALSHHHHHHHHHHQTGRGGALSFCNGRLGTPDRLVDYLASEGHRHVGKSAVDGDVLRTIMSLASSDHSRSVPLARHERGPSLPIMLPRHNLKDEGDGSFVCGSLQSETLGSNAQGSASCGNNSGLEGSPVRRASTALTCVASSPGSVRKSSFFTSALMNRVDSQASVVENGDEMRTVAEVDGVKHSLPHVFAPAPNDVVTEVGVTNGELFPVVMKAGTGAPLFTLTNLRCFESSLGPASVGRLPRGCTNVPVMVGVPENFDRPKELSSFQSFSSTHPWSALDKKCGWKRPWQALQESKLKLLHSDSLDLNAPAGDIDVAFKECGGDGVAQGQAGAVGAHYPEDFKWSAAGDCPPPLKIRACAIGDENGVSKGNAVRDVGLYSDGSLSKGDCPPESKNNFLSVHPRSALTLNRRRCLSSPEVPLLLGLDHEKSGDFLTLRLSSYTASPQVGVELNSEEMIFDENSMVSRADAESEEAHDNLQLQMGNTQQMGSYSPPYVIHEFPNAEGSEAPEQARLSYGVSSDLPSSLTEYFHKQTGRKKASLDLRLKLAL